MRIEADGTGGVRVNPPRPVGRGAYLCSALACLEQALRRRVLARALRAELPTLDVEALRRLFAATTASRAGADVGNL